MACQETARTEEGTTWTCPPPITANLHAPAEPDLPPLPHWEYDAKRPATYTVGARSTPQAGRLLEKQCRPVQAADAPVCAELVKQETCANNAKCVWDVIYSDDLSGIPRTLVPLVREFKVQVLGDAECPTLTDAKACNGAACYWKEKRGFGWRDECMELETACAEEEAKKQGKATGWTSLEGLGEKVGSAFQKTADVQHLITRCKLDESLLQEQRKKRYAVAGAAVAGAAAATLATTTGVVGTVGTGLWNAGRYVADKVGSVGSSVAGKASQALSTAAAPVQGQVLEGLKRHGKEAAVAAATSAGLPETAARAAVERAASLAPTATAALAPPVNNPPAEEQPVAVVVEYARPSGKIPPASAFPL